MNIYQRNIIHVHHCHSGMFQTSILHNAQDLKRANENRARVPWVLVMAHRPLYCTSLICRDRCVQQAPVYRSYLEDLLYQQRVDVVSLPTCLWV